MLYQLSYSWLAKKNSHMPPNHVPKAVDILGVSCETANGSNLDVEVNKGGCVGVCVKLNNGTCEPQTPDLAVDGLTL